MEERVCNDGEVVDGNVDEGVRGKQQIHNYLFGSVGEAPSTSKDNPLSG